MNKDFLKTIFHSDVGHVYEYIGSVPDDISAESTEMCSHVTEDFIKAHGDNQVSTMVVQLPFQNNKILLFCNSTTDINQSDEFVLLSDLVPDVVVVATPAEETPAEETPAEETPAEGEGQ